jgi:hypothetical protein
MNTVRGVKSVLVRFTAAPSNDLPMARATLKMQEKLGAGKN